MANANQIHHDLANAEHPLISNFRRIQKKHQNLSIAHKKVGPKMSARKIRSLVFSSLFLLIVATDQAQTNQREFIGIAQNIAEFP